ncbi:MAG TPA: SEC-C metal-binding domain-containing protein, partial [Usitatibacter sp.]|nr:SEC-C metal-binding domain-containing protein [Usitatibacter sp.]
QEKYAAILAEIERTNSRLQPVLVGTASIEKSETLAEYLRKNGYKQIDFADSKGLEKLYSAARNNKPAKLFAVLNARFHEQEAYIVAEAGVPGAITIATNMAGRGTDIKLGGSLEMRIQQENQTLASITFQNYFRLYKKLAGMTGTADTEAYEFQSIYNLEVVVIPPNMPMVRKDQGDLVYLNAKDKFKSVIDEIKVAHAKAQPLLVGTASIETSELLSALLQKDKLAHEVLNAKNHEREAQIIANAGMPGAITIATNMAGRGTDIVLGGSLEAELAKLPAEDNGARDQARAEWQKRHDAVVASGGLYVIGSERHESRRIDNQLRGRSGRQGDAGASRFYLSLDDTLMRIFTPPRMRSMLQGLGMEEGEAIEHRWVTRAIETAQRKVEAHNFDIRKHLLDYDNVANDQRKVIYELRDEIMGAEKVTPLIEDIRGDVVNAVIDAHIPPQSVESLWDAPGLEEALKRDFQLPLPIKQWLDDDKDLDEKGLRARIKEKLEQSYTEKKERVGAAVLEHFEKAIVLQVMDQFWREHLAAMDYLRQGIHLCGYAQKDPKQEYKREAFNMFNDMLARFKHEVVSILAKVQIQTEAEVQKVEDQRRKQAAAMEKRMQMQHAEASATAAGGEAEVEAPPASSGRPVETGRRPIEKPETVVRQGPKLGRNDPCWCGSGKKFKQCHGKLE